MSHAEIVCRCEEVTKEDIIEAIENGDCSLSDVKKSTRAGMGFCQGKNCKNLISRMLSTYYNLPRDAFFPGSIRLPIGPISLEALAGTDGGRDEHS